MHLAMRRVARPLGSRLCRQAHAAAFEHRGEANNHPRGRHPRSGHGHQRQHSRSNDYRFPKTGAKGGQPSPYEVLAIPRSASPGEIKAAYYKLALVLHPDSSHPSASAEHFAVLAKAYKLLSSTSSRNSYLQSGYGWAPSGDSESPQSSRDAAMREFARRAKANGAASWESGRSARRGYRESEAGRGAWSAFYHNHPGEDFPFHDRPPDGGGKPIFMGNNRFFALIASLVAVFGVLQVLRIGQLADNHRDLLIERHIEASNALAEARREAMMHGKERREKIHRRVRENSVMEEIGKMERGEYSEFSHARRIEAPKQVERGEA